MSTETASASPRHIVVTSTKSVGIQILLIFFLGPIGLFYSSVKGALIMLFGVPAALAIIIPLVSVLFVPKDAIGNAMALGLVGSLLLCVPLLWIGSWVWGFIAVNAFNRQLTRSV